ncbi:PQQ-binding-like beta-propeller repeat protein [Streptomyces sp. NPDC047000]|uniref:outer membrane protein assembly factor BamB family protein n=1 Tax=Streptomyces sp. NPDC047000 TaxID=3155474 RepID=UPI0033D6F2FD
MTQPPDQPPAHGGFGAPEQPSEPQQPPQAQQREPQTDQQQPQESQGGGPSQAPPPPQTPPPPQAPPAGPPPGYGYPQQPGPGAAPGPYNPPPPQGPYAQPGPYAQQGPYAQPGPYGAAPQPGPYAPQPGPYGPPQPGYGYPQQPPYPGGGPATMPLGGQGPGAPGGPRGPFKGRTALVVAAAVAALAVIGGTVYAVTSGGDGGGDASGKPTVAASGSGGTTATDDPVDPGDGSGDGGEDPENLNEGRKPGEAKVLWYKTAPDVPASGASTPGMWITGRTAVKAAYKQVFGYRTGTGEPAWDTVTFPEKICAVTDRPSSGGKVVIAYESGSSDRAKCNRLQQLDLDTGKKGWTTQISDGALFDDVVTLRLSITGSTLMVGRSQSGVAYDVGTGKKLFDKKKYGASCFPSAFAGGSRLIQVASCGAYTSTEHDEIQELDPSTGAVKWTQKVKKGWKVSQAYSVDPLVVYLTNDDKKAWNISTFNADGSFRSEVTVDEDFAPQCGWSILGSSLTTCQGVATDANTLYLPTKATTGPNRIVAISLSTGKEKWRVKSPADESMLPLEIENGKLIAYVEPSYDAGGQVVSIPLTGTGHSPTKLLQNPAATATIENTFFSRDVEWADGRLYISNVTLTGNDDSKEKLMLAFGN